MSGTQKQIYKIEDGDKSPILYSGDNTQVEVANAIERYLEYAKTYDEYWNYYAITLTMPDYVAKHIKEHCDNKNHKSVIGYFEYLLGQWGINGIWIVEHTKKGVEHLHGVVYTEKFLSYPKQTFKKNGKWTYTLVAPEDIFPYQHVIKTLPSKRAMTGWRNYMIKHCIHKSVIEYFEASADESCEES